MCILVREKAVDLTNKSMPTGEIYTRMVQCLYKKFTIRRQISTMMCEFTKVVGLVGKLAWETLLSRKPIFQRSRVEREVGKDAFDYGFLIGHEDLIGDVKADTLIAFAHRSIQEFFGASFFVLQLIEGADIDNLLGANHDKPIFMMNPLFLHFCFWFLSEKCSGLFFILGNTDVACHTLYSYIHKRICCKQLYFSDIAAIFPAIDILKALLDKDDINVEHFGRLLETFVNIKYLAITSEDQINWILKKYFLRTNNSGDI